MLPELECHAENPRASTGNEDEKMMNDFHIPGRGPRPLAPPSGASAGEESVDFCLFYFCISFLFLRRRRRLFSSVYFSLNT